MLLSAASCLLLLKPPLLLTLLPPPLTAAAATTAGDVWALGVCLYLFIFGCTPFSGQSSYQVYEAVQKQPLAFLPGKAGSEASAEVKHLISRCVVLRSIIIHSLWTATRGLGC